MGWNSPAASDCSLARNRSLRARQIIQSYQQDILVLKVIFKPAFKEYSKNDTTKNEFVRPLKFIRKINFVSFQLITRRGF